MMRNSLSGIGGAIRGALSGARVGAKRGYEAAGHGRRAVAMRQGASLAGPNAELLGSVESLRALSFQQARNNGVARSAIDTIVASMIGSGIKPMSMCPDSATKEKLQRLWEDWAKVADADGNRSFYGLQAVAAAHMVVAGETFGIMRPRLLSDGLPVPLQIQLVEADQCPVNWTRTEANGNETVAGVERTAWGKRAGYWLYPRHPMDAYGKADALATQPVRFGAENVVHLYNAPIGRLGAVRGEPWLTAALVKLYDLDVYDDAELTRKKSAASVVGFITRQLSGAAGMLGDEGDADDDGVAETEIRAGSWTVLAPGEDIKTSAPADVGGSYEPFLRRQLMHIARSVGIPYHELTGDTAGMSDRTILAIMMDFRRRVGMWQDLLIVQQFCDPIWIRFCSLAVLSGAIELPAGMSFLDFSRTRWVAPQWEFMRPVQEVKALAEAIKAGLMTRAEAVSRYGYDVEDVDRENAADEARRKSYGLNYTTNLTPDQAPETAHSAPSAAAADVADPATAE